MSCVGYSTVRSMAVIGGVAASGLMLAVTTARADRIDGEWCLAQSNLVIDGPTIRTPGGTVMQGIYDRHGFRYVIPANEPGAGGEIVMMLRNEETVELQRPGAAQTEIWRRCKVTS